MLFPNVKRIENPAKWEHWAAIQLLERSVTWTAARYTYTMAEADPAPGVGVQLHIEDENDLGYTFSSLINLLAANVKLHFIDEHHICQNRRQKDGFKICLTDNSSIKIVTINEEMRHSINLLLMNAQFDAEVPFIWQPEPHYNSDDSDSSSGSINETPIGCAICPICGKC